MLVPKEFIGQEIDVEISGHRVLNGRAIDAGLDILVLQSGHRFNYIPLVHVQHMELSELQHHTEDGNPGDMPITELDETTSTLSCRKILERARGQFVEIYVSGNKMIHGYITNVMNDYFSFYSPAYKTIFVSLNHLKLLVPYQPNITPYSLSNQVLPVNPSNSPIARVFEGQCKKLEGQLVVFDLGEHPDKIGLLRKVESETIALINAGGKTLYWNLKHLKTVHLP